jgi:predicted dehydrogenase
MMNPADMPPKSQKPLSWGVLSTAKIAREHVLPAMMQARNTRISAVASRNLQRAQEMAGQLGIPKAYGSYEELLADPEIDAVYNPLPNHLHAEWSIKALEAGKHVLCEKPLGLNAEEVRPMKAAAEARPGQLLMEAFMYRHHPQWTFAIDAIRSEQIGRVQLVQGHFSYYNTNKNDIRNQVAAGGGGRLDIGCYCVSSARWIFGREPERVIGHEIHHPETGVDVISTGMMDFGDSMATFSCSTEANGWQGVVITGTNGRIELPAPFNPASKKPAVVHVFDGKQAQEHQTPAVNQFTLQAESFADAVHGRMTARLPLEESVANMHTLDQLHRSALEERWVHL